MATVTLGATPEALVLKLTEGSEFTAGLAADDGAAWGEGVSIRLAFNDDEATVWTATLSGPNADWTVSAADVDALLARLPDRGPDTGPRVRLLYVDGSTPVVWAQGSVTVSEW